MYEIYITNPYSGHWGVIERVWGVPFLHFCSTDKAECEQWAKDHPVPPRD